MDAKSSILIIMTHVSVITHSVSHVREVECGIGLGIPFIPVCIFHKSEKAFILWVSPVFTNRIQLLYEQICLLSAGYFLY